MGEANSVVVRVEQANPVFQHVGWDPTWSCQLGIWGSGKLQTYRTFDRTFFLLQIEYSKMVMTTIASCSVMHICSLENPQLSCYTSPVSEQGPLRK